jgi:hypothetical protein
LWSCTAAPLFERLAAADTEHVADTLVEIITA